MRILAVYPAEPGKSNFQKMPPLGMLWIAAQLRKAGHEVEFLDRQVDERAASAIVESGRPALVLIGGTSHSRFASFEAAREVKAAWPPAVVIYGGPHASFAAEDTLRHVPEVDIVVRGEGEEACLELAEWAGSSRRISDLARIAGIHYRHDGGIISTGARPPILDLDALGLPARELVPMERYGLRMDHRGERGTSILTARGCPVGCSFCSASALFGKSYRMRSPVLVVDEIEELREKYGVEGIKIFDSTFTLNRVHVERFCAELLRRDLKLPWECEIRVGTVDKSLLARMREAGCYYVDVGIESGSQRVLDCCVGKQIRLTEADDLLRWTRELGILTKVFFTIGHPGETVGDALRTHWYLWKRRRSIDVPAYRAGIAIYPGTEVERYALERKLLPEGFCWSLPFVSTSGAGLASAADAIPLLLTPELGREWLRRFQILFLAGRPGFLRLLGRRILRMLHLAAAP